MSDFQPIVSSNLESAAYDPKGRTLTLRFKNGTAYRYARVMPGLWKKFQKEFDGKEGRSAGKFFFKHIKPLACEQIDNWK